MTNKQVAKVKPACYGADAISYESGHMDLGLSSAHQLCDS